MGAQCILQFEMGTMIAITHSKLAAENFMHCTEPSRTPSKLSKLKPPRCWKPSVVGLPAFWQR